MGLLRRVGSFISTLVGSLFLLLLVALVAAPALYLEAAGTTATGTVLAKTEAIRPNDGFWTRQLSVRVDVATADEAIPALPIFVDADRFDALSVGAPVEVRYAQHDLMRQYGNFALARLASQAPFGSITAVLGNRGGWVIGGVAIWLTLLFAWSRWRSGWLAAFLALTLLGTALVTGSSWQPAPRGPLAAATAQVRQATYVDKVWGGRRTPAEDAAQPFSIVQLEFVPEGRTEPVVAVDVVDAERGPTLRAGQQIRIHYSVANPRAARIDDAVRSYWWRNLRSFALIALMLAALIGAGWLLRFARQAYRRRPAGRLP